MKCGGCVRAVEQRLQQQPAVRQASVNLLTRTAWIDLEPAAAAQDPLPALVESLAALGFAARPREETPWGEGRRERLREQGWWQRWRGLIVALALLIVSGLGHLSEAGALPAAGPWSPLGRPWFHALVATLALAGPGRTLLIAGARAALAGLPSMDTLVGLGVVSAWLASLVGWLLPSSGLPCWFNEPVMLLGFVLTGRFLEERARWRTGRAIEELAGLQPDQALLLLGDAPPRPVRVGGLRPGDRIRLLPGDRVPVDAVVQAGHSAVDTASLTGEPLPQPVAPGSELAAGMLNLTSLLDLEVRRSGAHSAIARIVQLVERAQARKAPIQSLADRIAGRFTVVVLLLAAATFLFWWRWGSRFLGSAAFGAVADHGHGLGHAATLSPLALALQLAIAVLVVACPCALGLATPAAITVACGRAARAGLLFRGGDAIESAARLEQVLFDKTGTLTLGRPLVSRVEPLDPGDPGAADRLVQVAAGLEQQSRHPLAHALLQEAERRGLALPAAIEGITVPGEGLEGRLEGEPDLLRVGRLDWLAACGVPVAPETRERQAQLEAEGASLLAVAAGSRLLGLVAVEDRPRADAASTLAALRRRGLALGLLSGDRRAAVERLGERLGLESSELAWQLRPEQKLARLLEARNRGPLAMVGDGINDAPALAAADLGVAIGTGTQIAQESADLVVLGDRLEGLVEALDLARRTMATVRWNLVWAFGYNLIALPIAAGALLPRFSLVLSPPLAALLMALSSLTVVLNALLLHDGLRPQGRMAT
ncbi:cation-translocating P-type ATPase [Cyanobium sp. FGCU-6]|jgi:Cu2+-exporting ATPase|nr:cation-translocating P-type ATPase [Cyanobium sp. FGCU6]